MLGCGLGPAWSPKPSSGVRFLDSPQNRFIRVRVPVSTLRFCCAQGVLGCTSGRQPEGPGSIPGGRSDERTSVRVAEDPAFQAGDAGSIPAWCSNWIGVTTPVVSEGFWSISTRGPGGATPRTCSRSVEGDTAVS
jgi:hypothetical protein